MSQSRPLIMGILNVTPDSFSDGNFFADPSKAVQHAQKMADEGADIIDIGGESTRPNATPVPLQEELDRTIPIVRALTKRNLNISIDTQKSEVARQALEFGATMVNDVSGLRNPLMRQVVAKHNCQVVIMHMPGDPTTMQSLANYENVVTEVRDYLLTQAELAQSDGIKKDNIIIDPGIGFGKTVHHNLELIRNIHVFTQTPYRVLVGVSRKAFIGKTLGSEQEPLPTAERWEGSLAVNVLAQAGGARILRVHDVKSARRAADMAFAVLSVPTMEQG